MKGPFQLADLPPLRLPGWNFIGEKDPGEAEIPYRCTEEKLAVYKSPPIDKRRLYELLQIELERIRAKIAGLLALDHRYLIICNALPSHSSPFE